MRNRVAHHGVQSVLARTLRTATVLTVLPVVLIVAAAHTAGAETAVAAGRLSFGVAGPVGIAAVLIGMGGLVAGLVRRRRTTAARAAAATAAEQPNDTVMATTARGDGHHGT